MSTTIKEASTVAVDTVIDNIDLTFEELASAAAVLMKIAKMSGGEYEALKPWNGTAAFDSMGNGQSHTNEWKQWAAASDFVNDAHNVSYLINEHLFRRLRSEN